jgi:hypothetical protein
MQQDTGLVALFMPPQVTPAHRIRLATDDPSPGSGWAPTVRSQLVLIATAEEAALIREAFKNGTR